MQRRKPSLPCLIPGEEGFGGILFDRHEVYLVLVVKNEDLQTAENCQRPWRGCTSSDMKLDDRGIDDAFPRG